MELYRGIAPEYRDSILKEYEYWTLMLHGDQRYLGRAMLWLVREGTMQDLTEISLEEQAELFEAMKEYNETLTALFSPDKMNYAWLGNCFHEHSGHGHMHLIPRYKGPCPFVGIVFSDDRWGENYAPYVPFETTQEVWKRIRNSLRMTIPGGVQ